MLARAAALAAAAAAAQGPSATAAARMLSPAGAAAGARAAAAPLAPALSPPLLLLRASYHKNVVDHYERPRNVGSLDKSDPDVGTGLVGAPACGDVMKLQIKVDADGNIQEAVFKTFGCGSAIASSSVATEWVKGRSLDGALEIRNADIAKHLSLPPVKLHCSMLAQDAIAAAVADVKAKRAAAQAAGGAEEQQQQGAAAE
jgi:Fe-S cluster assembly scaffold IscU